MSADDLQDCVAILSMVCRLPGAASVDELWRNLAAGVESISVFSDAELRQAGVPDRLRRDPAYVRAWGVMGGGDRFDAGLFGLTPREAERTDPQHRVLLECAWEALETAGYGQEEQAGPVGVFVGADATHHLAGLIASGDAGMDAGMEELIGAGTGFLATRISYKLNLAGPSLTVQTACSTSLVALHLACKSLLDGECDLALAGGVALRLPEERGYRYQEGGIYSPDGHCRAFDAEARGTVGGHGAGIVLLKRLEDALADGDAVRAVVRATAINNDGAGKVGFTAPSVDGQARVIAEALALARIDPATVGYVETHGTGTPLGDPIELAALAQAFRAAAGRPGSCALGSIKTNLGHLGSAAGVAGLIKAVLALEHGAIPPSLHFHTPNPRIDFAGSPFHVASHLIPWPRDGHPRRAGVSSFGIGGTNVHAILEEAPPPVPAERNAGGWHLLPVSARTETALEAATERLASHLAAHPELDLADVAFTLQAGRRAFEHRTFAVAADLAGAVSALRGRPPSRKRPAGTPAVAFLFPGQGAQRAGAGREIYEREALFKEEVDRCCEILQTSLGCDLRQALFNGQDEQLLPTAVAQPALFVLEYALARLWISWGIQPAALCGHSVGEYTAACLAGVFDLPAALELVAARGAMMQRLPRGAMLAVPVPEEELAALLEPGLAIAAVNAPGRCVAAGPEAAIAALEERLRGRGLPCRRLATSHGFHSELVEPILAPFAERVRAARPQAPRIPFLSNVTGTWITPEEAVDPGYWARHLRATVRFADGVRRLAEEPGRLFLEVGPGDTLTRLARQTLGPAAGKEAAFASLPKADRPEPASLLEAAGHLWLAGARLDGPALHDGPRRRVHLPAYPFERRSYRLRREPEAEMVETAAPIRQQEPPRRQELRGRLQGLFAELFGVPAGQVLPGATFLEMGADSLFLLRASQQLQERLGAKVPFRRLIEELSTIDALAEHLAPEDSVEEKGEAPPAAAAAIPTSDLRAISAPSPRPAYIPHQPIDRSAGDGLSPRQREHLDGLVARLAARTRRSKELAQEWRRALANRRATAGFRLLWKELVYPLVAHRAAGSRIWDLDGNEYVDLTMGFGALLFGHSPDFLQEALREQLDLGVQIGPESETAGEVAARICALTGAERATFCNSGTEAVMSALRIARAATGRSRIALFAGSYHGTFDGVLARPALGPDGRLRPVPIAPGVPQSLIDDVLVLDYESPESLALIEAHAGELAAVLAEPVQSRRPELDNAPFLRRLREITAQHGIALIFDEVITGFRMHPGGVQALFGVQADLATYGKAVANGLPIGVIAGKARFMDAVDGGDWRYGDRSLPEAETTFFSGTFFRHPLVMAAALAVLRRLEQEPGLQEELGRRAAELGAALDTAFAAAGLAAHTVRFGSLLAFRFPRDWPWADLFFFHLLEQGIYVWERRLCYLSTAHTEEDLRRVVAAAREALRQLALGGFLGEPAARVPLTADQREIWAVAQLGEAAAVAYNLAIALRLRGPLRQDALARAVQGVVDRHEALRLTVDPLGETQSFAPRLAVGLTPVDLAERDLDAWLEAEARRPFDLARGPLFRCGLARLSPEHHVLALHVHHIAADGRSLSVLLAEIARLYEAPAGLPAPASFAHWAAATAARQQGPEMDRLEAFWLARLAPPLPAVELPADRPRPPLRSYAGELHGLDLDPRLAAALRRLAGRTGATLFMLLLAGIAALLHRLTGEDDLVVGIPAAPADDEGPLVGYCLSFLPLRARLSGETPFAELVHSLRRDLLDAYEHAGYPLSRLVRKLGLASDPGRPALLAAAFNLDRSPGLRMPGLEVEVGQTSTRSAPFDLDWNATERPDGLTLDCTYSTALFDRATIARWQAGLARLLAGAAAGPDLPLGDLPLLAEAERHQLLREWNATNVPLPAGTLIHERVAAQAARTPERLAVLGQGEPLTYRELDRRSNQLAHHLLSLGVEPEAFVGLCAERSPEQMIGLLAILKAGAACLPLDPRYPRERLAAVLEDAGAGVVLAQDRLLDRLPRSTRTVRLDGDRERTDRCPDSPPPRRAHPESLAYMVYTSGSTGRPKGVLTPHRALLNDVLETARWFGLRPDDRVLQFASPAFDVMLEETLPTWLAGAAVMLPAAEQLLSTAGFERLLAEQRITVVDLPSSFWHEWVADLAAAGGRPPASLRFVVVGSEKVHPDRVAAWGRFGVPLLHAFGTTETTITSSFHWIRYGEDGRPEPPEPPIGRPLANTAYYLLDRRGRPTPRGVPGELCIGGAGLARGYHHRPELTAERFVPDPFSGQPGARLYRTGDRARYRPDGNAEHLGRVDHQVKVRGVRIEPQEVEAHLARHPAVRDAAVVAQPGPGGDRLIAYVVPQGDGLDAAGLRRALGRELPPAMVPAVFVTLGSLPRHPNGKVDRRSLPEPGPAAGSGQGSMPPATPAEQALAAIWRTVLRVERVGAGDRFYELGGDSILALQVLARARQAGLAVNPLHLLEDLPLAELAAGSAPAPETAPSVEAAGEVPLTPSQRGLLDRADADPHHWNMSLLREAVPFVPAALERAAAICLERHDALRLRFEPAGGTWRQRHAPVGDQVPFTLVDLSALPEPERLPEIERAADRLHGSLDLARGPLVRFAAFDLGRAGRLLAVAHQLVVDFVSWQILAEDLETAYDALLQEREPRLPPRTASYAEWARRLDEYAQGDRLHDELGYWLDGPRQRPLPLPLDHPLGSNREGTTREIVLSLTADETRRLLAAAAGPRLRDLLLAAVAQALAGWTGDSCVRIDLEGHGREPLFADLDLSRTVGWFGVQVPLLLDLGGAAGPQDVLERVRQQLQAVPRRGTGFGLLRHLSRRPGVGEAMAALPAPEVGFSYQGILQGPPAGAARLIQAGAPRHASRSPRALRLHVLEIESYVADGRLQVIWQYSAALHRHATIEDVVRRFEDALRRLSAASARKEAPLLAEMAGRQA